MIEKEPLAFSKEELSALPIEKYTKKVVVVDNEEDAEEAVKHLSRFKMIGFDTETRPAFKKGVQYQVALIQLATEETTYLFRINCMGFPPSLKKLFENPAVTKIGLSLKDDFAALRRLGLSRFEAFIELQNLVQKFHITNQALRGIYGVLFGKRISKSQRLTNWEAPELSEAQKEYAALDAWACLRIYIHLMKYGVTRNAIETPHE